MSPLKRTTEVVAHREGGDPNISRKSPGQTHYEPIMLERGRTHGVEFERWANKVWHLGGGQGAEVSLADFRKDIRVELQNEAGQLVMAFNVFRCWPRSTSRWDHSTLTMISVAIESLTLQHEGWLRDPDVPKPKEPPFNVPPS